VESFQWWVNSIVNLSLLFLFLISFISTHVVERIHGRSMFTNTYVS
jgi:hypothetical protein